MKTLGRLEEFLEVFCITFLRRNNMLASQALIVFYRIPTLSRKTDLDHGSDFGGVAELSSNHRTQFFLVSTNVETICAFHCTEVDARSLTKKNH